MVVLASVAVLALPLFDTGPSHLSAYSRRWNDISGFRDLASSRGLNTRALLTGPGELAKVEEVSSVLVVIGMEKGYSAGEIAAISTFASRGGDILLADDFGYGNAVLENITAGQVRINNRHLRDIYYDKNPDFIRAWSRATGSMPDIGHLELLLDRPAALEVSPVNRLRGQAAVLANSSSRAWLDGNDNLVRDPGEPAAAYPVAAYGYTSAGAGRLVVVSDPGLFVNEMIHRADNSIFISKLLDYFAAGDSRVIIDESRHIPETAARRVGTALLQSGTAFAGNGGAVLLTLCAVLLLFGYHYTRVPPAPAPRRHRDRLDDALPRHFRTREITAHEVLRLKVAILERVRLASGWEPGEFYRTMLPRLPYIIENPVLHWFLADPGPFHLSTFEGAIALARAWTPRSGSAGRGPDGGRP